MEKIIIEETQFEEILKGVSKSCSCDDWRPELKYIRFLVNDGEMTAYALNGWIAAKVSVPFTTQPGESVEFYILPIKFKASKNGGRNVEITINDNIVSVTVPTDYGNLAYQFAQPKPWTIKIDSIFADAGEHDREIGVNANLMIKCLKAISETSLDTKRLAIIESKPSKTKSFIIRSSRKGFTNEQLILPVKYDWSED